VHGQGGRAQARRIGGIAGKRRGRRRRRRGRRGRRRQPRLVMIGRPITSTAPAATVSGPHKTFAFLAVGIAGVKRSHELLVDLGGVRIFLPLLGLPFFLFLLETRLFHGRLGGVVGRHSASGFLDS